MDLKQCREEIDKINNEMLELFCRRMRIAEEVAHYKSEHNMPILNSAREREILSEMTEKAGEELETYTKVFYSVIMDLSRSHQAKLIQKNTQISDTIKKSLENTPKIFPKRAKVACQGVEGAYSQIAADKLFGIEKISYFKTFEDVFLAVNGGECDFGVLPIENSTYGTVIEVYDLMKRYSFNIVRSIKLKIQHKLLAKSGTSFSDLTEVYSHSQAIGQCGNFFRDNPQIKATICENTAAAAKKVAESGRSDIAAIASDSCADIYGLKRLMDDVQNNQNNYTRFICISKNPLIYPGANKISVMLTLHHTPGALYNILAKFTAHGLNLTKLENRPIEGSDFDVHFYFDFEASPYDDNVLKLLDGLNMDCESFNFLGGYTEV